MENMDTPVVSLRTWSLRKQIRSIGERLHALDEVYRFENRDLTDEEREERRHLLEREHDLRLEQERRYREDQVM